MCDYQTHQPLSLIHIFRISHILNILCRKDSKKTTKAQMKFPSAPCLYLKNNLFTADGTTQFQNSSFGYTIHFAQLANCCSVFSSQSTQGITTLNAVVNRLSLIHFSMCIRDRIRTARIISANMGYIPE